MKIKKQLQILILIIVIIPLTAVISLPVYHYLNSPERYLMQGYKEVRRLGNISMSDNEWQEIKDAIKHVPPEIQLLIYYDNTVITSSIPQIKSGQTITTEELFDFIHSTSGEYDYQIHEGRSGPGISGKKGFKNILIISRASIHKNKQKRTAKFVLPAITFLILFETGAIIAIWKVSRSIASSISYVEEHTRKIADGNLDARIMLVGQDWGSPADASDQYMAQFGAINKGSHSSYWLDGSSITDTNLIALFSSIGYDISSGKPWGYCSPL